MENMLRALKITRDEKGQSNTGTLMTLFNSTREQANELIDYLEEEGYIHVQRKTADGYRRGLKLTSTGINFITKPK